MKIKACNAFSCLEEEMFGSCDENLIVKLKSPFEHSLRLTKNVVILFLKTFL